MIFIVKRKKEIMKKQQKWLTFMLDHLVIRDEKIILYPMWNDDIRCNKSYGMSIVDLARPAGLAWLLRSSVLVRLHLTFGQQLVLGNTLDWKHCSLEICDHIPRKNSRGNL